MMVDSTTIFQTGQILLAVSVAVIPPLYPEYSIFVRNAHHAVEEISKITGDEDSLMVSSIEPDDKGFDELIKSIDNHRSINAEEVTGIGMVRASTRQDLNNFLSAYYGSAIQPNFAVFALLQTGERVPIICHPFNPQETTRMTEIEDWIHTTAIQRSNRITAALAVSWATIAIILIT